MAKRLRLACQKKSSINYLEIKTITIMQTILINIIESVVFGMLISTTLVALVETAHNIRQNTTTKPEIWIVPGIFAGLFWFIIHL